MTSEFGGSGDVNRSLVLLWHKRERPVRGPKPALTLGQIVAAAVKVADADGLDAVSMRRIANAIGVGTMSLYRYVPGKAELLDLMLDYVIEPDPVLGEDLSWREVLELFARGSWELYQAHRWLLQVDQSRPLLGPNALTGVESILRGLGGLGLTDQERVNVLSAVDAYVTGLARNLVGSLEAERRTGVSDQEFWAMQEPILVEAMASGEYPTLAQLDEDAWSGAWESTFEFGLARLLDGLATFIGSRAPE
jgi:AcrR family transcriptional regulator